MSDAAGMLHRYVDWLSEHYRADARYLAVLRVAFAAYVLLFPTDLLWVADLPDAFFDPRPGPFRLLTEIPPPGVLVGIEVARAVLAALVLVGYRTALASVLLTVTLLLGHGILFSFGKVDHAILVDLLPAAMAAAGWGAAWSLDRRLGRGPAATSGFAILLWGLVVGFAMLTAAAPKVDNGWLDPTRHASRGYVAEYSFRGNAGPLAELLLGIDNAAFWKLLDYGTVAVEAGLVVALLYPPLFRLTVLALIGFHVGVYLSLGINFRTHGFVYYPFLYGLIPLTRHALDRGRGPARATEESSTTEPRRVRAAHGGR